MILMLVEPTVNGLSCWFSVSWNDPDKKSHPTYGFLYGFTPNARIQKAIPYLPTRF